MWYHIGFCCLFRRKDYSYMRKEKYNLEVFHMFSFQTIISHLNTVRRVIVSTEKVELLLTLYRPLPPPLHPKKSQQKLHCEQSFSFDGTPNCMLALNGRMAFIVTSLGERSD